jgi:hypothetical protein
MQHFKFLPALCLCTLTLACKRPDPIRLQPTIEEPGAVASIVRINDPTKYGQLGRGFYELEVNTWRWAAPKFDVILGTPPTAPTKGAVLFLDFTLPEASIATLKNITITGKVAGTELAPETYTTPGSHVYRREVPAAAFSMEVVNAEFSVDKFVKLTGDGRDLALITKTMGLESK